MLPSGVTPAASESRSAAATAAPAARQQIEAITPRLLIRSAMQNSPSWSVPAHDGLRDAAAEERPREALHRPHRQPCRAAPESSRE